jgi:hypothetical protein
MGYRGRLEEQRRACELRAAGWTYAEICAELGVSKASVSLWVRDVEVDPALLEGRRRERYLAGNLTKRPHRMHTEKLDDLGRARREAVAAVGGLSERDLFVAGIALYAGEGFKTGGCVGFANTDPAMVAAFLRWQRTFFAIDESRLRVRLYLHEGLDLEAAEQFWSDVTGVPRSQFTAAYRAVADASRREAKHPMGCPAVRYACARTLRTVLALTEALLQSSTRSGVAQPAERRPVKAMVLGSTPSPGAPDGVAACDAIAASRQDGSPGR